MSKLLRGKCILFGNSAVGKTALCQMFHSDGSHFSKNYTMTTNIDLLVKAVKIPDSKYTVEFHLYDIPSKDIYSETIKSFLDNPAMVAVVYDITDTESFAYCKKWLNEMSVLKSGIPCALIANKIDLDQHRNISLKEGMEFAESHNMEYFEVSAKDMQNVDAPFIYLAREYCSVYEKKLEYLKTLS